MVQLLDQSVTGFALLLKADGRVSVGDEVVINFGNAADDEQDYAIVRTIQERGIFSRIGLRWCECGEGTGSLACRLTLRELTAVLIQRHRGGGGDVVAVWQSVYRYFNYVVQQV